MARMGDVLKAPHTEYIGDIFKKEDPKELFVALNELCFHLSNESKNVIQACYWIEWILEFECICKNKNNDKNKNKKKVDNNKLKCERRAMIPVESKSQMDIVWIIWDIFLTKIKDKDKEKEKGKNTLLQKIMGALLKMFCLKYTNGCAKRRKNILYFAVSLLCECENIHFKEEIIREEQKSKVATILKKIDSIYYQIKKNEHSPGTEYLFKDVKASNLEKTIEKLEAIDSFGEKFIPRTAD
jgi:hypothetical protein